MNRERVIFVVFLAAVLISLLVSFSKQGPAIDISSRHRPDSDSQGGESPPEIPNIVHFAHFIPPSVTLNDSLNFEFRHFISIYSAYYYFKPDRIYIHTDAPPDLFRQAGSSSDKWTRHIAKIPSVVFNHETIADTTSSGKEIKTMEAKSDFLRTRVMKRWGGIYLDDDSYVLKDVAALRKAGYENVVGRTSGETAPDGRRIAGWVACGMFLSTPENDFISVYQALQDLVFDGGYLTHANLLIEVLASDFAARERSLLILDENAFYPTTWFTPDLDAVFQSHNSSESEEPIFPSAELPFNFSAYIDSFQLRRPKTWHIDWRGSYAVHGYNFAASKNKEVVKRGGIQLDYVLERSSNFARAVYPAIKHAIDNGFIEIE
jgi:Glycosyltransferase sugar-binding region containing DXD motif